MPQALAPLERAVEVLSCLVTRTPLKEEMTFGSGRCRACLPLLLQHVSQESVHF
jgi:hypothetical protein